MAHALTGWSPCTAMGGPAVLALLHDDRAPVGELSPTANHGAAGHHQRDPRIHPEVAELEVEVGSHRGTQNTAARDREVARRGVAIDARRRRREYDAWADGEDTDEHA
jgi:hypothetical protein